MANQISPQATVQLEIETHYLEAGIPPGGSKVFPWSGGIALVYNYPDPTIGYIVTDVSGFQATFEAILADPLGMAGTAAQSISSVIPNAASAAVNAVKSAGGTVLDAVNAAADGIGNAIGGLVGPTLSDLTIPVVIIGAIAVIYLLNR